MNLVPGAHAKLRALKRNTTPAGLVKSYLPNRIYAGFEMELRMPELLQTILAVGQ
jgi:hypothetical protein